jgi:hypothetical protein
VIRATDGQDTAQLSAFSIVVTAANRAPTISGAPPTSATVGAQYSFTPTASDADGDTLTFSITNRPSWATFSTSTGRLQGTPAAGNVGSFAGIVIAVTDGEAAPRSLPSFSIAVGATGSGNAVPTISGNPSTSVMVGNQYAFTPTANDADGGTLSFSITNKPSWATFSTTTGQLQGTPVSGSVGTTTGIVIGVTDGVASVTLPAFSITVQAVATGSATVTWVPPTQNADGSALTNLAGFKVYWGTTQGSFPNSVTLNNAGLTTYVVESLVPGTYYFATTAFNSSGVESNRSNTASKTIQ